MRKLLPSLVPILFLLSLPSRAADLAGCLAWEIPEGPVARVEVDGATVWPCIPYATNGLVAYWDGIWNSGVGRHDGSAETWVDLSGNGNDATLDAGGSWTADALVCDRTNRAAYASLLQGVGMVELVYRRTGSSKYQFAFSSTTNIVLAFEGASLQFYDVNDPADSIPDTPSAASVAYDYPHHLRYLAGVVVSAAGTDTERWRSGVSSGRSDFGLRPDNASNGFLGEICALRFYSRPLSAAEAARHAAIDALRFGIATEAPSAAMLSTPKLRTLSVSPNPGLQSLQPDNPSPYFDP